MRDRIGISRGNAGTVIRRFPLFVLGPWIAVLIGAGALCPRLYAGDLLSQGSPVFSAVDESKDEPPVCEDQRSERDKDTVAPTDRPVAQERGVGALIDRGHAHLYSFMHQRVERFDRFFSGSRLQKREPEPSRFRLGMYSETLIDPDAHVEVNPLFDFDADIDLPNIERRLKITITTIDPTRLPGTDVSDQRDSSLRTALVRQLTTHSHAALGVRARWKPEPFAHVIWSPRWPAGNWSIYPQQKVYWEYEPGWGEITSLVFDHWNRRWNTRFSTSVKWSEQDWLDDRDFGRKDSGFRWSEVMLFGYAAELIEEKNLGRIISGEDLASGWNVRLGVFGGFHVIDEYRARLYIKHPVRNRWMFLVIGPELRWQKINSWDHVWAIKVGFDVLFNEKDRG